MSSSRRSSRRALALGISAGTAFAGAIAGTALATERPYAVPAGRGRRGAAAPFPESSALLLAPAGGAER